VVVFFSEKTYWYVQGYPILELVLYYSFPLYASLWAIEHFRVRSFPALILISAMFGFLVEGVLTPVIYEAGLLDPLLPAYFIGWHGLLSIVFGWYLLRKWLVGGQWRKLLLGAGGFGLLWGIWSLTYWLPENINDPFLNAEGMRVGVWPVEEFALFAFTFTLMLILAHWLLGRGLWQSAFQPSKTEKWLLILILSALFGLQVVPVAPLGFLKLAAMLGLVYIGLHFNRRREPEGSLLAELVGGVKLRHALLLLVMPAIATLVYGLAAALQPAKDLLRLVLELTPLLQGLIEAGLFVWALVVLIWSKRKQIHTNELETSILK
jgi:hypothetical protein